MLVVGAMGLAGCGRYNWRTGVASAASVQHGCPVSNIQVVNSNGDLYARVVELHVCGQRRVYQDLGGEHGYAWVDQTPRMESPTPQIAPAGDTVVVATVASPEGPFSTLVRSRVDAARSNILTCTGGPTAVIAEWNVGQVRMSVRGETDVAVAQCVASAIGTIDVPAGTLPGRLIHPIAP